MKNLSSICELNVGSSVLALEPEKISKKSKLIKTYIEFVRSVIGNPDYGFTLTLNPVAGHRRLSTKINDTEQAMDWFLHVLNTKCLGHGYRRKSIELGIFATIEGLGIGQQQHLHGAIRLPKSLKHQKFLGAFEYSIKRTKRFGEQWHLEPYYEYNWLQYITKTGVQSVSPRFLRKGTH